MTAPGPPDPRRDGSGGSDRRLDFDERRSNDRRESDQLRMGWMRATQEDIHALKQHYDEIMRNQIDERQRLTALEARMSTHSETLGIDERGRFVKGGMVDVYSKLAGAKTGLFWLVTLAVAAMGVYSTTKEVINRWLGH